LLRNSQKADALEFVSISEISVPLIAVVVNIVVVQIGSHLHMKMTRHRARDAWKRARLIVKHSSIEPIQYVTPSTDPQENVSGISRFSQSDGSVLSSGHAKKKKYVPKWDPLNWIWPGFFKKGDSKNDVRTSHSAGGFVNRTAAINAAYDLIEDIGTRSAISLYFGKVKEHLNDHWMSTLFWVFVQSFVFAAGPYIYRHSFPKTFDDRQDGKWDTWDGSEQFAIQFIRLAYTVLSFLAVSLIMVLISAAQQHYNALGVRLDRVLHIVNPKEMEKALQDNKDDSMQNYYLPLRDYNNLHYWVMLRDNVKRGVDDSVMAVISVALAADIIIILTVLIRLLVTEQKEELFSTYKLLDNLLPGYISLIFSIHLVRLIIIVVRLNTKVHDDTIKTLEQGRLDLAVDVCRIEEKLGRLDQVLDSYRRGTREAPVCRYKTVAEEKRAEEKRRAEQANEEFQETLFENNDIIGFSKEDSNVAGEKLQREIGALKTERDKLQAHNKLVVSAVTTMQLLDEPIRILGLTVNVEFMVKIIGLMASGAISAIFQYIRSSSGSSSAGTT